MMLPEGPVFTKDQAVYILHVSSLGYFKVGRARDPIARASQIQNGCPEKIEVVGSSQIDEGGIPASVFEQAMHRALTPYRSHGEWFAKLSLDDIIAEWQRVWNGLVATTFDGGVESRHASASGSGPLPEPIAKGDACSALEPPHQVTDTVGRQQEPKRAVGVTPDPSKRKLGRPLAKDADKTLARTKPWEAEGMSRRTWFRRRGVKA